MGISCMTNLNLGDLKWVEAEWVVAVVAAAWVAVCNPPGGQCL